MASREAQKGPAGSITSLEDLAFASQEKREDLTPDGRYGSEPSMSHYQNTLQARIIQLQNDNGLLIKGMKMLASTSEEKQNRIVELHGVLRAFVTAANNFVAKVDSGHARSVVTYAELKEALRRYEAL